MPAPVAVRRAAARDRCASQSPYQSRRFAAIEAIRPRAIPGMGEAAKDQLRRAPALTPKEMPLDCWFEVKPCPSAKSRLMTAARRAATPARQATPASLAIGETSLAGFQAFAMRTRASEIQSKPKRPGPRRPLHLRAHPRGGTAGDQRRKTTGGHAHDARGEAPTFWRWRGL